MSKERETINALHDSLKEACKRRDIAEDKLTIALKQNHDLVQRNADLEERNKQLSVRLGALLDVAVVVEKLNKLTWEVEAKDREIYKLEQQIQKDDERFEKLMKVIERLQRNKT